MMTIRCIFAGIIIYTSVFNATAQATQQSLAQIGEPSVPPNPLPSGIFLEPAKLRAYQNRALSGDNAAALAVYKHFHVYLNDYEAGAFWTIIGASNGSFELVLALCEYNQFLSSFPLRASRLRLAKASYNRFGKNWSDKAKAQINQAIKKEEMELQRSNQNH